MTLNIATQLCLQKGRFREADSYSVTQSFSRLSYSPKLRNRVYKRLLLVPVLCLKNPIRPQYFCKLRFNSTFSCKPMCPKCLIPVRVLNKNVYLLSRINCYVLCSFHSYLFGHYTVCWTVRRIQFLFCNFPQLCYFILSRITLLGNKVRNTPSKYATRNVINNVLSPV